MYTRVLWISTCPKCDVLFVHINTHTHSFEFHLFWSTLNRAYCEIFVFHLFSCSEVSYVRKVVYIAFCRAVLVMLVYIHAIDFFFSLFSYIQSLYMRRPNKPKSAVRSLAHSLFFPHHKEINKISFFYKHTNLSSFKWRFCHTCQESFLFYSKNACQFF